MKIAGIILLAMAAWTNCYIDTSANEGRIVATVPYKTLFFLRKLSPYTSRRIDRPLPMGAQKRLDSEEKFSPFHSVLVIKRQQSLEDPIGSAMHRGEAAESFIKDFLVSHLQHINAMENNYAESTNQFNTEKIYNDLYKKQTAQKISAHRKSANMLGDEIDSIMANAAKEITPQIEEIENKGAIGKTLKRTKRQVGRKIKKARGAMKKGVKVNGYTILLFVVICLISGFAGYSIRGKTSTEHYVPLDK
ncbi:hypothetical protein NEMIN01_0202 [Nematocida minor]|uniref:uncharacterized protein n=1 Tax=Nematocida minor TaxID=1912983 RepID=UPI0022211DB4|nr:uncharacterized protein NEMIN01_0098 [Nematocida minor]XP_051332104.1 uncharacterized protein NEMIN01_0202 [Nematocida minor]KAI5188834.1 hypothetical protein NEMIN01_0098 [Nematocida minor]KAI5188938.1 hypothetical protein NEMIN01_0202 [Nematocida minor]